jgi:hypothetical protein
LFDDLWDCVWEAVRTPWRAEIEQVEASLNEQKDQLAEKIFPLLVASELGQNISRRAKEIKGFRVTEFRSVETELPSSQHRPPDAATYARPEGCTVSISACGFRRSRSLIPN